MIRKAGIATLLAAAALALTGCWATVYYAGGTDRIFTVKKAISDNIIWDCTAKYGSQPARDFCALDTIHDLCYGIDVPGISEADCNAMSSHGRWQSMEDAIMGVVGPYTDCLAFYAYENANRDFWSSLPVGQKACN